MSVKKAKQFSILGFLLLALIVIWKGLDFLMAARSASSVAYGVVEGRLTDCPPKPDCVSSQTEASDTRHHIEPLEFEGNLQIAFDELLTYFQAQPNFKVIENSGNYMRVEAAVPILGIVDDLEFFGQESDKVVIHVRSASRIGLFSLGQNKRRIDHLRKYLSELNE